MSFKFILKIIKFFSYPSYKQINLKAQNSFKVIFFSKFSQLQIHQKSKSQLKTLPKFDGNTLKFGLFSTDYILQIDNINDQWQKPIIKPFKNFSIHPFNTSIHYSIQCFQGLKAYKNNLNQIRLFRPQCNMYRLKYSANAISLPVSYFYQDFDGHQFLNCIKQLIKLEQRWIPTQRGFSLYIRPTFISMQNQLGVKPCHNSKLYCVVSPTGPYYQNGFKPISLYAQQQSIRAAPGGLGQYKIGCNYAGTIKITKAAIKNDFQQVLWLYNNMICEVGSSNIFFVIKRNNKTNIITPKLNGMILPGITRDTIINLIKQKNDSQIQIFQQDIYIETIIQQYKKGNILEIFGSGTAVIVSPVNEIGITKNNQIQRFKIDIDQKINAGPISYSIFNQIINIQQGIIDHYYSIKI